MYHRRYLPYFILILIAVALKSLLSVFTFWNKEFIDIARASTIDFGLNNSVPWIILQNFMYRIWLVLPMEKSDLTAWFNMIDFPKTMDFYILIFLLKLPTLISNFFCGALIYLIVQHFRNKGLAFNALVFWLFNPYLILFIDMYGSNETLPLLFLLGGLLLFLKRKKIISSFLFLISTSLKLYTAFLIPLIVYYNFKRGSIRSAIALLLMALTGVGLYVYWVSKSNIDLMYSILNYSPFTFYISEILLLPYGHWIGLSTLSGILYLYLIIRFWKSDIRSLFDAFTGLILIFFAFLNWRPTFMVLLIAFLTITIYICKIKKTSIITLLSITFLFVLTSFEQASAKHLFYFPNVYKWMEVISNYIHNIPFYITADLFFKPIFRSLYAIICLYYAMKLLVNNCPSLKDILVTKSTE
ncbi:MAG: hypothetical protein ACFE75_09345 [Candidatus Hodarchaeota archaeon]